MVQEASLEVISASLLAPLALFVAWRMIKSRQSVRHIVMKYLWSATIFEAVLLAIAAYCLGVLAERALIALGVSWASRNENQIPLLFTHLAVATGISRFAEVLLLTLHGDRDRTELSRLSRTVLYGTGLSAGLLVFLISNGYTLLSISTGAIAAGFAFAAQRTMGDLIAGVALSIEGAFRIGDWLRLADGTEGEVINIDWRATHLKGWDSANRIIPNAALASQSFVRLPRGSHPYGQNYEVRISAKANPEKVLSILTDAVDQTEAIVGRPAPAIRLSDATTEPYAYSLWVHFENYLSMFAGRDELFRNIHAALDEAGLRTSARALEVTTQSSRTLHSESPANPT